PGVPVTVISLRSGTIPGFLPLTDNGNNSATISGTPPSGSAGTYKFTLRASNNGEISAFQEITINVGDPPVITSPNTATFTTNLDGSFFVTTSGSAPITLTRGGAAL